MALEEYFTDFTGRDWEREDVDGTVRMAVVGVGGFARNRALPAIEGSEYCRTTTLVTGSPATATDTAEAFGANEVIDYDAYLSGEGSEEYDAVYVATPNALHGEYAIAAAEQGKHVICEKPLETDLEAAREVVDACADADVTLMTAYRLQLSPTIRRTREIVDDGLVGDVVQVHGAFSNPILETAGPDSWRLDPDLAGGGALVDLGIYPLNTAQFVLEDEPEAVYACTRSSGGPFAGVDEHVAVELECASGAIASCSASFLAHPQSQLQLMGTGGRISISAPFGGPVPQDILVESGDMCMEYTGEPVDEVREEFDYFGYCVLTDTPPEPDGADGLADLRIIESAYESAETSERVELE